jgi:hypothetical protein
MLVARIVESLRRRCDHDSSCLRRP